MGMLIAPETPYGQELWKFDHHTGESIDTPTGKIYGQRAQGFQAYPAMLYMATQKNPWVFEHTIAADEPAQRNLESRGFVAGGKGKAMEAFDAYMQSLAVQAAHRNHDDQRMSEAAKAESNAYEQAHSGHVGEIPRTPIKQRGRPATVKAEV